MITKQKALVLALALAGLPLVPASAQSIKVQKTQKANWYKAPPELQIIDERPMVKDFREAPSAPQSIQLPPPPQGFGGGAGGGAGALGGDDPGGGGGGSAPIQIPGNGPGYRNYNPGTSIPLPHADFGHAQTNIPAGGIHPGGVLPSGVTSGIHGKVMPFNTAQPMLGTPAMARPNQAKPQMAPTAASYSPGGGYGPSVGGAASSGGANTAVSGKLLNMLKHQK